MDISRFRLGDWVLVAAGVVMLVLGLAVPWVTVTFRGDALPGARNAFSYPLTGGLAWVLVVGAGVITFLRAGRLIVDGKLPWTRLVVLGAASALILMVLRILIGAGDDSQAELGRGAGMLISLLAAAAALFGAVSNHRAEGGELGDLVTFGRRRGVPRLPPPPGPARRDDIPPPSG